MDSTCAEYKLVRKPEFVKQIPEHFWAQSFYLALNDVEHFCMEAVALFDLIQGIYNFFSASIHLWSILLKHINNKVR